MNVFLGDTVTLVRNETYVTGAVSGVVLDKNKQLERIYIEGLTAPFWLADNWKFLETEEEEEEEVSYLRQLIKGDKNGTL